MSLWTAALLVFILNLPFGYWRRTVRKLSLPWFLSIHVPVPLVVALRLFAGLGWSLVTFPVLVGAFSAGQLMGGGLYQLRCRTARGNALSIRQSSAPENQEAFKAEK